MGYWILMAMMVCALAAVIIAVAIEHTVPAGRRRPSRDGAIRWLAVVSDRQDDRTANWAEHLERAVPDSVQPTIVTVSGPTTADLRAPVAQAVAERNPDVVLLWTSFDDVLAGVPLNDHEIALDTLLAALGGAGATAVIGNVPDLSRLPGTDGAGLPTDELRLLADRWNASIARLVHHHGALIADLRDLVPSAPGSEWPIEIDARAAGPVATPATIADRFLPVLRQALVGARRRRDVDPTADSV
jgi:hypothetical protein